MESITREAVGLKPETTTGIVESSQENVIMSGVSFIVWYPFSDGAAVAP